MSLTVIHPFGAYQAGDVILAADVAAILASENVANVVLSHAPGESGPDPAPEPDPEPEPAPQPKPADAPEFAASAPFVSDFDPS